MTITQVRYDVSFMPGLAIADACAAAWLRQATLRLRREIAWQWHQRDVQAGEIEGLGARDVLESLDLVRTWSDRRSFLDDVSVQYLNELIAEPPPVPAIDTAPGTFSWVVRELALDETAALALALGLLARLDAAAAPVFAACLGRADAAAPTLSLLQKLIDQPGLAVPLADPAHPVWRRGLLACAGDATAGIAWEAGFAVPPLTAMRLIDPDSAWPPTLTPLAEPAPASVLAALSPLVAALRVPATALRLVPVETPPGAEPARVIAMASAAASRTVCRAAAGGTVQGQLTLAWLHGADVWFDRDDPDLVPALIGTPDLPVTVYLSLTSEQRRGIPADWFLPRLVVPHLDHGERVAHWSALAGSLDAGLIEECARRFRFEAGTIRQIAANLAGSGAPVTAAALFAACRAAMPVDLAGLAQPVTPRFTADDLVLPPAQQRQFGEIVNAMRNLTQVHYGWGTARAWNESGIPVLFAGPSGTGKTMAAEVLATMLDLPMYRINLAQMVDKYVGETEKNFERVLDACDGSDVLVLFDEADASFGRRTGVRDAHDRYANLEVSYLLERLERFKGLAILATNRREDIDEAFLRRLRYIMEFPVPDVAERRRIWQRALPARVDASTLDLDFLARQFQLTGGNIRSIILNACLQAASAGSGQGPWLTMEHVIVAVVREYAKLQRTVSLDQFGPWADVVEATGHA